MILSLFGSGESAPDLSGLRIAVVGAGNVGSEVIGGLERLGVGQIDVYEADRGVAGAWRGRHAVHVGDFWDELTLARLRGYDFAICTVADHVARVHANQKCLIANVNLMLVWTQGDEAIVSVHPFNEQLDDCACYECGATHDTRPVPIASLRLSLAGPDGERARVTTATAAAGLAVALVPRVAVGVGDFVARRATLDASTGTGESCELPRDRHCSRCRGMQRPVPIVRTRNRWDVPAHVLTAFPETLEHGLELSDAIGDDGHTHRLGDLATRFRGVPIPAKFALTVVDGRVVCLDFEAPR